MAKKKAAWTVLVYLAGDNNLSTECLFALTEMKKAAPAPHINVVAQFDPQDPFLPTQRYEINRRSSQILFDDIVDEAHFDPRTREVQFRKESKKAVALARKRREFRGRTQPGRNETRTLAAPIRGDDIMSNDTDSSSPITLYNFISWGIQEYPADHYMVVLSGHAGGTERDYLLRDESSRRSLTFNELKLVFDQLRGDLGGSRIEILGMDNCLMCMAEICYELRESVDIIVGCESYSPASGWPYRRILERMRSDCNGPRSPHEKLGPTQVAKAIVDEYVNYYADYWLAGLSIAQSALDVTQVDGLKVTVDTFADSLNKKLNGRARTAANRQARLDGFMEALVLAHWEAQSYNGELYVDLYDFCDCLERRSTDKEVRRQCQNVKKFIASKFVLASGFSGAKYQYSHGVSLYFPWDQVASSYFNLEFVSGSPGRGWAGFLDTYVAVTRRGPRWITGDERLLGGTADSAEIRMTADRMTADRMTADRMTANSVSGNAIHSMRNPPIVFFPSADLRDSQQVWAAQKRLFTPQ
ncbi:MAG: clostripain-related cysteine peptidase [Pyrinomonadaceae bacterium]